MYDDVKRSIVSVREETADLVRLGLTSGGRTRNFLDRSEEVLEGKSGRERIDDDDVTVLRTVLSRKRVEDFSLRAEAVKYNVEALVQFRDISRKAGVMEGVKRSKIQCADACGGRCNDFDVFLWAERLNESREDIGGGASGFGDIHEVGVKGCVRK